MREEPPEKLIALVERLGLATREDVRRVKRLARRLARRLPLFESVWIDALVQARLVTPFQASEIKAGRGDALRIGPYVLARRLPSPAYAERYVGREVDSGDMAQVAVVGSVSQAAQALVRRLEGLVAQFGQLDVEGIEPIRRVGAEGERVWAASRYVPGRTPAQWIARKGRLPPLCVLEIARQIVAGLMRLEEAGLCHGDVGALGFVLTEQGDVVLQQPGLQCVLLSAEGVDRGDVYGCGCLWWHLLTGRAPFAGTSGLAKLPAVESGDVQDVRRLAPETPPELAEAISACTRRLPGGRPESMARVGSMLGPSTRSGRVALGRCLRSSEPGWRGWPRPLRPVRRGAKRWPSRAAAAAGWLIAVVAVSWSVWHGGPSTLPATSDSGSPDGRLGKTPAIPAEFDPVDASPVELVAEADAVGAGPRDGALASWDDEPRRDGGADGLVLPGGEPVAFESLDVVAGQRVRGEPDRRPTVLVPYAGLTVWAEGVRFENIDFVWDHQAAPSGATETQPALFRVAASRADFRACSFRASDTSSGKPAALLWTFPADRSRAGLSLLSGRLRLSDCVVHGVGAAVSSSAIGTQALEMRNVLLLAAGPLVELDHAPNLDEPVLVGLSNVTLRNSGPLVRCRYDRIADEPGGLLIEANGCVLAIRPDAALLSFVGPSRPGRLLNKVRLQGQGSLVLPEGLIAAWARPGGSMEALDDAMVSIAGVVRSKVEFAGLAEGGAAAHAIVRWQVPLRSPDPPGIDPERLLWWAP